MPVNLLENTGPAAPPVNLLADSHPASSPVNLLAPSPVNLLAPPSAPPVNLLAPQGPDLNATHPVSRLPMWEHNATEEINNTPGALNDLSGDVRKQIMSKWQTAAQGGVAPTNPHFTGLGENQGSGIGNAFTGGVSGGALSLYGLAAPKDAAALKQGLAIGQPYEPTMINNIAAGAGGALLAAPVALTTGGAGMAVVGAGQGAGGARTEIAERRAQGQNISSGQELAAALGQGAVGAGQGYLQGKILGGAGKITSGLENPILRAAAATGVDVAGNALLAPPATIASNLVAKGTYDPNRPVTQGVGQSVAEGIGQGLGFAPMSVHGANAQHEVTRQNARANEVLQSPAAVVQSPGGSDARAMHEVAMAATGKAPVWYQSESPRAAFLDPKDGRMYVNVNSPREALEEAGHALFRGELKPHVQSFIAENPDLIGAAAQNKADQAEAVGDPAYAEKVRADKKLAEDEGFANTLVAGMTPEAIANLAKTNPNAFMRAYERVLGVVDRITGGNRATGRLVERQLKQFLDPLRANLDVAKAGIAAEAAGHTERKINAEEDRLDAMDARDAEKTPSPEVAGKTPEAPIEQRGATPPAGEGFKSTSLKADLADVVDENAEAQRARDEQLRKQGDEAQAAREQDDLRREDAEAERRSKTFEARQRIKAVEEALDAIDQEAPKAEIKPQKVIKPAEKLIKPETAKQEIAGLVDEHLEANRRHNEQLKEQGRAAEAEREKADIEGENRDAQRRLETVGAVPLAATHPQPVAKAVERPAGFGRGELEAHFEKLGHGVDPDDLRDRIRRDQDVDGHFFSFPDKLPTEVKEFMEGRPETRRLFTVARTPSEKMNAAGPDAMNHPDYYTLAELLAGSKLKAGIKSAQTGSENDRFLAHVYEQQAPAADVEGNTGEKNLNKRKVTRTRGEFAKDQIALDASQVHPGHAWEIDGLPARVTEGPDGERLLQFDGKEYDLSGIDKVPVDKGTYRWEEFPGVDAERHTRDTSRRVARLPNSVLDRMEENLNAPHQRTQPGGNQPEHQGDDRGGASARQGESSGGEDGGSRPQSGLPAKESADSGEVDDIPFSHGRGGKDLAEEPEEKPAATSDTGLFGQTVFRPATGNKQGGLFHEPTEINRPAGDTPQEAKIRAKFKKGEEDTGALFSHGRNLATGAKALAQNLKDKFDIDPLPKTTREAPDAADKLVQHASVRIAVPKVVNDLLSRVFPDSYKDQKAMAGVFDVMVKDNVLGGYDSFDKAADKFASESQSAASDARDKLLQRRDLSKNPPAGATPKDIGQYKRKLNDDIRQARALSADLARQSASARESADAIEKAHDLPGYENDVQAAMKDAKTKGAIDRWKQHVNPLLDQLFNEMKAVDPQTPREGRGRHFEARVNLLSKAEAQKWVEAMGDEDKPLPAGSSSNYRNPNAKKDQFDQRASFTGDYDTDPHTNLTAVLGRRMNEVTKLRAYDALVKEGAAVRPDQMAELAELNKQAGKGKLSQADQDRRDILDALYGKYNGVEPEQIGGQDVARMPIKVPETSADGSTRMVEKSMLVRQDLVREIRDALDTDQRMPQSALAKALTSAQLLQASDAVTHFKNLMTVTTRAMGAGPWKDMVKRIPGFGTAAAAHEMWNVRNEVSADTPAIREEIAKMAQEGNIRAEYPKGGLAKWNKASDFLHAADTAGRIILNRYYDRLVEGGWAQDTPASRRRFINQLGQYNSRLMGPMMRSFKQMGLAPFVVAGRNFTRQGIRGITGNPGFDATSPGTALKARGLMLLTAAMAVAIPTAINMATVGQPGGRSGTPLGAIDLGTDEEDGKHKVVDLMQLSGIRRGLRATGLDAAIEGVRQGKDANQIIGQAVEDVGQSQLHPWVGPAPAFAFKALTGRQLDMRGKMEAQQIPGGGAMQYVENARAALESQNPFLYAIARPGFKAAGLDQKPADEDSSYLGQIGSTIAKSANQAAGVKDVQAGKDAAETLAERLAQAKFGSGAPSPDDAAKIALHRQLLSKFKADPDAGKAALDKAVEEGQLSERAAANIVKKAGSSSLAWNVKALGAEDAARVYKDASPEEQASIREEVVDKIAKSSELSADKQDELLSDLGIEPPVDLAFKREYHALNSRAREYAKTYKAAQGGDKAARAKLSSLRLNGREQGRLSKLRNISQAMTKAKKEGPEGAGKVKRLAMAAA